MKILFYALTQSQGGIENFIYTYYSYMSDLEMDFIGIGQNVVYEKQLKERGVKIFHLGDKHSDRKSYYREMEQILKQGDYDTLWFNDNNLCDVQLLKYAGKHHISRIICHSHGASLTAGLLHKIRHYMNRSIVFRYATDYWACSEEAAKWAFGKKWKKIGARIIINAIEVTKYQPDNSIRQQIRTLYKLEDKYVIGHVGRFCKEKNHKFLLDAFKEFHMLCENSILLLVGNGELEKKIKEYAKELKLGESVLFLGQRSDVCEILQSIDLFLVPSLCEGLCIAAVEAQAAGVPCIVSDAVPKEVKLTEQIQYLRLADGPKAWAESMQECRSWDRQAMYQMILDGPYNVENAAETLEKMLLRKDNEKRD
ncbi:MAG: glycosyltransferase [Lachnospiraceae bacterium]|nr:glycosyltransferase [Lachnospiraceae bacterium]